MQENINIPDSEITTNLSFRQLVLMNMQQLTNFPYIEKDFDALTDYELLCLVVKFLNDVIANQNEQNDSITRMYQSFLALQDYVNNTKDELETAFNNLDNYVRYYFDNLDVQEEINNKLDKMLEDGVLEQIIDQFIQSSAVWGFDTVADMKDATNLINGSYAQTFGFHNINDGGNAIYKIRNKQENEIPDEMFTISLYDTSLIAEIIIDNNTIYVDKIGAYGDGLHDDTHVIESAIKHTTSPHIVQFSAKTYAITNISINYEYGNVILKGINSHYRHLDFTKATKIIPYSGMSGTMFTVGENKVSNNYMVFGFTVKNICFTSDSIEGYDYNCFDFGRSSNLLFENVIFRRINGFSIKLKGVYDSVFSNVEFMYNGDYTSTDGEYSTIIMEGLTENNTSTASNALRFDNCRWESNAKDINFDGNYNQLFFNGCKIEEQCSVSKILISGGGEINFTNTVFTSSGTEYLIAFNNTLNRALTKFVNCTFTAPSSGLSGGKWINVIQSNANGIIIDGCSFNMPNFNGSLKLGNYTKLFNSTFYSYSSDEITKVIEADYYCDIENLTLIFLNNPKPVNGSFILLNYIGNTVKNIISSQTTVLDYSCIVKATSQNNILDSYFKVSQTGASEVDARQSNIFNVPANTTVNSITNSWNGCEITFYSNGANVVLDFTGIPLLYNYITSLTIPAGRTATLKKVSTTQWVLIASNA